MAGRAGRVDAYYVRGMLEIRPTLHLAQRLGVRANQLHQQTVAGTPGAGWRCLAVMAFVVLDVVVWRVLRHSDRFGLRWRLPLDAADAAFWTTSPLPASDDYGTAIMVAIPLAVEAGVRLGWRGLLVPTALLLVTGFTATLVGKPVHLIAIGWLALGVGVGVAFYRHCRLLDERAEQSRERTLAAARRRAYLAGQNQVAMGASSAVDAIEGLVPVLGRPLAGSALWQLADGWKTNLSASTAQEATYLQVALLEWERVHNGHPDLSGLVRLRVPEGQGTTLLSAAQARELHRALHGLDLRGRVVVGLAEPDAARLPGQALELRVNGRTILVPADERPDPPPFDPAAVAYLYVMILTLAGILPKIADAAVPAALAGGALCALAGIYSHRRILTVGEKARPGVLKLAVAVATVLTLLSGFAHAPFSADGDALPGYGTALLLLSFIGGYYWRSLGRWAVVVPLSAVVNVALGVLVFPVPSAVSGRIVLATVAATIYPFFACVHLAGSLERATARHESSIQTIDEDAERAAFVDGSESVVGLVHQARDDAMRQLKVLEPELDARIAALAADRLEEVEQRLRTITVGRESSSSTTTS